MDLPEAFAQLRVAAKLYASTAPPPRPQPTPEHMEHIRLRESAVWQASEAGVSDGEIAKVLGIPRENVKRMRERYARKRGWETPAPVVARRPVKGRAWWDVQPTRRSQEREREAGSHED